MPNLSIKFKPAPTFDENPMDFILSKYKSLHKTMVDLMTDQYKSYITGVYIVAPKPTTFKIVLHNNQEFILTYTGPSYICKIDGKKYYLNQYAEKLSAIHGIAQLLELGQPLGMEAAASEPEGPEDTPGEGEEFAGGGGEGGGEEAPAGEETTGAEELAEQKIRIIMKENDEEPSASAVKKAGGSEVKKHKQLSTITQEMKKLAAKYKAGDKSVIDQLKRLTAAKKKLEAELLDTGGESIDEASTISTSEFNKKFGEIVGSDQSWDFELSQNGLVITKNGEVMYNSKPTKEFDPKTHGLKWLAHYLNKGDSLKEGDFKSMARATKEEAMALAQAESKECGCVQHVQKKKGYFYVDDWYDHRTTVASFEGGRSLREGGTFARPNPRDINSPDAIARRAEKIVMNRDTAPKRTSQPSSSISDKQALKLRILQKERERIMADMEQEAEPEGGPIADRYGAELNKIDNMIAKLQGQSKSQYKSITPDEFNKLPAKESKALVIQERIIRIKK